MTTLSKMKTISGDPKCTICEKEIFEIERISPEKIKLTCDHCGEKYLLFIDTLTSKQLKIEFSDL